MHLRPPRLFRGLRFGDGAHRADRRAMLKDRDSALWKLCGGELERVDGKTAFDGMRAGDKCSERVVKRYIGYLAEGITNLANVFRPEAILLGGGVCAEGDNLLKPLKRKVHRLLYGGTKYAPVEIAVASLGNDAGLCGAARLARVKECGRETIKQKGDTAVWPYLFFRCRASPDVPAVFCRRFAGRQKIRYRRLAFGLSCSRSRNRTKG